jgi:carbonic anhydrase/acetyltransferase-like protein (isoleucine patch superfamily)
MKYKLGNKVPDISSNTYIAPGVKVIGDVVMKEGSSVWFNAVIRADNARITIGENSNIQDGSVLHVDDDMPIVIDKGVTIGHKVMLHGCFIGENTLIGINAVVLNGAKIGKNCLVGANTLIPENKEIPDGSLVMGAPGKVVRQLTEQQQEMLRMSAQHYKEKATLYGECLESID